MNNIFVNICDIWKHAPGTKFTIDGELYLYIGRTTEEPSIKMYQYSTNLIRYEEEFAEDSSFELYDAAPEVRSLAIIHLQEILRLIDDGWTVSPNNKYLNLSSELEVLNTLIRLYAITKELDGK